MTQQELKKIMNRHGIFECDLENTINFVNDLLEFRANEVEQDAPYATKTIDRLRCSAYEVYDLIDYIDIMD